MRRFGTLFCHEWGVLEDSEALVDTILLRKMRSTIWEWSQSLQGSGNNKKKTLKYIVEHFGTLFYHEWGVLEDSEALVDTILLRKMRSTIWEWSQSLQGSGNNKKTGNTKKKKSKIVLGCFGTLVCHEWGVLEDSEALVDTILLRKMRSTIWEWSQSLWSSRNKEKIGNT